MKTRSLCGIVALGLALAGPVVRAATITVTKTGDSGAGTLRQAIADNEAAGGGNTIDFSVTGTITLTSAELLITKNVTIVGPGARLLTVQRSTASGTPKFRIFTVALPGGSVTASMSGLTIANGFASASDGGGIKIVTSTVTVTNCTFSGNHADFFGGGLFNLGTMTLANCTFSDNDASGNDASFGGGIYNGDILTMTNCTVADNMAGGRGGGLFNNATVVMHGCTIASNSTSSTPNGGPGDGAGIYNNASTSGSARTVQIGNTIVAGNTLTVSGGSSPDVEGTFISDGYNLIRNGAGGTGFTGVGDQVGTAGAPINANLSPLQNNGGPTDTKKPVSPSNAIDQGKSFGLTTDQRGRMRTNDNPNIQNAFQGDGTDIGAVEVQPSITSTVTNNNDTFDGSLRERILDANAGDTIDFASNVTGTITLTSNRLLVDKSLTIVGPGARTLTVARSSANGTPQFTIFSVEPPSGVSVSVSISRLTIANGNALFLGGGIYNSVDGTLAMSDCAISGNNSDIYGGGLCNNGGTVTLANCTFSGNTATSDSGGGIYNGGALTMTNCTLANNSAGSGGGLFTRSPVVTRNCTISGNSASSDGGGIYGDTAAPFAGTVQIGNTIVAGNSLTGTGSGPDVFGGFASDGYNLIRIAGNASTGFTDGVKHDQVGTSGTPRNAFLGSLKDNGGPTDTEALGSNSPAIDSGNDATAPARDQRRASRVGVSDIGAFEFNGIVPLPPGVTTIAATNITSTTATLNADVNPNGLSTSFQFTSDFGSFPVQDAGSGTSSVPFTVTVTGLSPNTQYHFNATVTNNGGTTQGVQKTFITMPAPSQLLNVSTRKQVMTGDNRLIAGFIVAGNDAKKVIVLGIGPSLTALGVPGVLANPTLELHDAASTLATNDDWKETQPTDIAATGVAPTNDLESAILATLPGAPASSGGASYTAILAGKEGSTGIGVLQVYDLDQTANSKLANISTRGFVGTGDDLLFGGFIPGPANRGSIKVLVRAIGPSLSAVGISGPLNDPTLELHDSNGGTLATNDNWKIRPDGSSQQAEIEATGAPPADDRESAIVATVPPNNSGYTAIVRGANNTTGIAVVEVYALQ
jgi:hypothetical protein